MSFSRKHMIDDLSSPGRAEALFVVYALWISIAVTTCELLEFVCKPIQ